MSTHINAKVGEIAERVILPGDPLRAEYMANKWLEGSVRVNETRNMWGYSGTYKGRKVSIMPTGMGIPSMIIYVTELCRDYGCKKLIRVGTCGAHMEDIKPGTILVAQAVSTTSNIFGNELPGHLSPIADFELLKKADELAKKAGLEFRIGNVLTAENFYLEGNGVEYGDLWGNYGVIGQECEGEGLYAIAAKYSVKALMMTFAVGNFHHPEEYISADFQSGNMDDMLKLALDMAVED